MGTATFWLWISLELLWVLPKITQPRVANRPETSAWHLVMIEEFAAIRGHA